MGTTIYSPLMVGVLAGRYNDGIIPEGRVKGLIEQPYGRAIFKKYFGEEGIPETKRVLVGLADIAKDVGFTQPQLCLAWNCKPAHFLHSPRF